MSARSAPAGRVSLAGFRAGWSLVRRLPAPAAYRAFGLLAEVGYRRDGPSVQRLRANYALVRPDLEAAALEEQVRQGMQSYLRYWCDAFRLPDRTVTDLGHAVRVVGDETVRGELKEGRSVVVFLAHLGNWDLCGAWATSHLAPVVTVAERLRPEELFEQFVAFRESLGMTVLPLTGSDGAFRALLRFARDGRLIPLLADRDLTAGGVEVDFCGHRARMAAGPAALALAAGAMLVVAGVHYEPARDQRAGTGSGWTTVITFSAPVPAPVAGTSREKVLGLTQACADLIAGAVQEHLADWHMMQRVFEPAPPPMPRRHPRPGPRSADATARHTVPSGAG